MRRHIYFLLLWWCVRSLGILFSSLDLLSFDPASGRRCQLSTHTWIALVLITFPLVPLVSADDCFFPLLSSYVLSDVRKCFDHLSRLSGVDFDGVWGVVFSPFDDGSPRFSAPLSA